MTGVRGLQGPDGARGATGAAGPKGEAGRNGKDSNVQGPRGAPGAQGAVGMAGANAEFQWEVINNMIANQLYKKLSWGSEYCGMANEMCKGGLHVDDSTDNVRPTYPDPVMPTVTVGKPVLDMVVVVDGSDSLSNEDWGSLRSFLVEFIHSFNTPEIRAKYDRTSAMVVVQFSSPSDNPNDYAPDGVVMLQGQMSELDQMEAELDSMIQMRRGSSAYAALEFVINDVIPDIDYVRSEVNANVVQEHNRILTMVVNGEPDDAQYSNWNGRSMSNDELLHALDMNFSERYVIAVGSDLKRYGSAYEMISKNSENTGIYFLDGYTSTEDLMYQALGEAFLETLVEEMTVAALKYEIGQQMVQEAQKTFSIVY